jgi:hypothetical protein
MTNVALMESLLLKAPPFRVSMTNVKYFLRIHRRPHRRPHLLPALFPAILLHRPVVPVRHLASMENVSPAQKADVLMKENLFHQDRQSPV